MRFTSNKWNVGNVAVWPVSRTIVAQKSHMVLQRHAKYMKHKLKSRTRSYACCVVLHFQGNEARQSVSNDSWEGQDANIDTQWALILV